MSSNLPTIEHKAQRVLRTLVQTAVAFVSFAAVVPLLVAALGAPQGSTAGLYVAAAGTWITTVAGIISRVMAIPAVDAWLTANGLGSVPKREVQLVHVPSQAEALAAPAPARDGAAAGAS